jgi:hypothetical protein
MPVFPLSSTPTPNKHHEHLYIPSPSCLSTSEVSIEFRVELNCPELTVVAADGRKERVQFDKITARVSRLCYGLDPEHVDAAAITQKVISGVYQGVTTVELDNLVSP